MRSLNTLYSGDTNGLPYLGQEGNRPGLYRGQLESEGYRRPYVIQYESEGPYPNQFEGPYPNQYEGPYFVPDNGQLSYSPEWESSEESESYNPGQFSRDEFESYPGSYASKLEAGYLGGLESWEEAYSSNELEESSEGSSEWEESLEGELGLYTPLGGEGLYTVLGGEGKRRVSYRFIGM